MANEGSTKPTVNGFCEKHQPNQAVQYAGCWVCSREEETALIEQFLNALGWGHDEEAEENLGGEWWSRAGEDDGAWKTADAVAKALDDYDSLREAHKKAHLYGAGQKAENLRVRGLLQRLADAVKLLEGTPVEYRLAMELASILKEVANEHQNVIR